jgi:hypothetical protein
MTTTDSIAPIVKSAYGDNGMADALIELLVLKIDTWPRPNQPMYNGSRENMVRMTCWDWFGGGGTAASVAQKIEAALDA